MGSTRLSIVLKSLDDISERLDELALSARVRELRIRAERYERAVLQWVVQPPSETQRAMTMKLVLELHGDVIAAARSEAPP